MKPLKHIISILIYSIPVFAQTPDTLWTKHFRLGASQGIIGNSVQKTQDGGFIIVGTKFLATGGAAMLLIKTANVY